MVKKLRTDNTGAALVVLMFILTIFVCGALYTLLFIEVAIPRLSPLIPDSDSKILLMMCIYAIPIAVILVSGLAAFKETIRKRIIGGGY